MEKTVKIYHLHDSRQYEDEKEYWRNKTPEERLYAAELLRVQYMKLKQIDVDEGLQRVYQVTKRK